MTVAELFIKLELKGGKEVDEALSNVKNTLGDVASSALKVTAAIAAAIAAFYAFGKQSNTTGLGLQQFANLTGLSTDMLQRWQQLAIHSGESAEEMTQDIAGLQEKMTKGILGQGFPGGINALSNKVGFDVSKARDTFEVMAKLREYAQKTKDTPDIANEILGSFISKKTAGTLRTSTFDLNKADKSRMYTKADEKALADMSIRWTELLDKIEHALGRLNIRFGPSLLKDIELLIPRVLELVTAFADLANKLKLIQNLGKVIGVAADALKTTAEIISPKEKDELQVWLKKRAAHPTATPAPFSKPEWFKSLEVGAKSLFSPSTLTTTSLPAGGNPTTSNSHVQMTNTFQIYDASDPKAIAKQVDQILDKKINDATRQLPQGGGQ